MSLRNRIHDGVLFRKGARFAVVAFGVVAGDDALLGALERLFDQRRVAFGAQRARRLSQVSSEQPFVVQP